MPGAAAALLLEPDTRMAVAVLANQDEVNVRALARTIASWAGWGMHPQTSNRPESSEPPASQDVDARERFSGSWRGIVQTHEGDVPLELDIDLDGVSYVGVGNAPRVPLLNASVEGGGFSGRAETRLPTSDAMRHAHVIDLLIYADDDDKLSGQLTALTPGQPAHFALSHYVMLTREEGASR